MRKARVAMAKVRANMVHQQGSSLSGDQQGFLKGEREREQKRCVLRYHRYHCRGVDVDGGIDREDEEEKRWGGGGGVESLDLVESLPPRSPLVIFHERRLRYRAYVAVCDLEYTVEG
jgi:hypothetical protein